MNLSTKYLGLNLKNPIIAASSPVSKDTSLTKRFEDAGASAVVMYSLFEEQINYEKNELNHFLVEGTESFAEALSYFPEPSQYSNLNAEEYLEHLFQLKKSLGVPVIASLNGVSNGGWISWAKKLEQAGASAIELNIYFMATQFSMTAEKVEQNYIDVLKAVKRSVSIPVAMKVGPYFSAFANFAQKLDQAGADGLVLFNRFFGPDIDLDKLEVQPQLALSNHWEMRLPLRWIAVLKNNVKASLAATSGIKSGLDVVKLMMAGADATMLASVMLEKGPTHVTTMLNEMKEWMTAHEYESVEQMKGSMSYKSVSQPAAYERANYMKTLGSYQ